MSRLPVLSLIASSFLVAACGGGASGGPVVEVAGATEVTVALEADTALTGTAQKFGADPAEALAGPMIAGEVVTVSGGGGGFPPFPPIPIPRFGQAKTLVSFDVASIPAGATILSAELAVVQAHVDPDPYGTAGPLLVDHVDLGGAIDSADYDSMALQSVIGALSNNALLAEKRLDVTAQIQADVDAGRGMSSFRAYFGGMATGAAYFQDPMDVLGLGAGLPGPVLTIRYQ